MAVTSVSSSNTDISVVNGTTTPVLTLDNVNGVTKNYYDPTSSIQTQLNSKADVSVYTLIAAVNTDITTLLQSALNTYNEVIIDGSPGQYLINDTLTMPSNVVLRGVNNAQLTCGNSPASGLATYMRYIHLTNNSNTVSSITFSPSLTGFPSLSTYGNAAIYIEGAHCLVENCTFDFSFTYDLDVYAVWFSNTAALYNKVLNNKCYTVGIRYAENGSSYNIIDGNYVLNAGTIGLEGTGNGVTTCVGNILTNNTIIGSGYIGIEDQQNITGTIIKNNIVLDSGLSPNVSSVGAGMGISAVGGRCLVTGNEINGFILYGIEAGGSNGTLIDSNLVTDLTYTQTGIFINSVSPHPSPELTYATSVLNNDINGCYNGITMQGDYTVYLSVINNSVQNFTNCGIGLISNGSDLSVNIDKNTIVIGIPFTGYMRIAINTYTSTSSVIQGYLRISNNNINYLSSAGGSTGGEAGIVSAHGGVLIENNVVNTNNVASAWPTIFTYASNGYPVDGAKILNNKSYGTYATVGFSPYTNLVQIGNNWPGGDRLQMSDEVNFAYDADYTVLTDATLTKTLNITANRFITLPTAADYAGKSLKIWNQNVTGFTWNFATTVLDASSSTITTLTNLTWYILESDGNAWIRIS